MRTSFGAWLAVLGLACAMLQGCGELGERSFGENKVLTFEYSSSDQCTYGCAVHRSVVAGTSIGMRIDKLESGKRHFVRSTAPEIADSRAKLLCFADDTRSDCSERIMLDTKRSGAAVVEVVAESTGTVVDRIQVVVSDATELKMKLHVDDGSADHDVEVGPSSSGTFDLRRGASARVEIAAFDQDHQRLLLGGRPVPMRSSDERVLEGQPGLDGSSRRLRAVALGASNVVLSVSGASSEFPFRVVE